MEISALYLTQALGITIPESSWNIRDTCLILSLNVISGSLEAYSGVTHNPPSLDGSTMSVMYYHRLTPKTALRPSGSVSSTSTSK
jgi:hypothetical protein